MAVPGAEMAVEEAQPSSTATHGPGARFAGRVGRHAAFYGMGTVSTALAGLVSVAVFTRFLAPAEFGKMAVLSTVATIVTLLANLSILPGTMRRVYGTTGDEDVGEVGDDVAEVVSSDPRLALSTGLALTTAIGAFLFLIGWALQNDLAGLFGDPRDGTLIFLAVGAGVAGAVMRFCQYILRLQLRSLAYLMVTLVYAFGSIAVAIPLLEDGLGIEAVLLGFIVANGLAAALSLSLLSADLRPAVSLREAAEIVRGGMVFLPIILSFQTLQLADTLFVAAFASFSQTGLYRVAQRIATPVSYGTSVFQQSWGPMRHDLTKVAVDKLDESRAYTAHLFTYYAVFVGALILTVTVFADQLVRLAAGDFGEAATLVPLTTVSVAGHGWFILSYRMARLPGGIKWMVGLSIFAAVAFTLLSIVFISAFDAVGAPLAAIAAWGMATGIMLGVNQTRGEAVPFEYRSLLVLLSLTLGAGAIAHWLLPDTVWGTIATAVLLLAWAVLLLATGVVPFREVRALARYVRHASGIDSKRQMRARIANLDGVDAVLVDELVRQRHPPDVVAERAGMSEEEVMARAVHALRSAAGGGEPTEADAELGHLILIRRSRAERDIGLLAIVDDGADPIDADLIQRAASAASSRRVKRASS